MIARLATVISLSAVCSAFAGDPVCLISTSEFLPQLRAVSTAVAAEYGFETTKQTAIPDHIHKLKGVPLEQFWAYYLKDGELDLIPRRWSLLGIPLPKALLPQGRSYESAHDGVFTFDVTFKTPFTGPIATYSGQLTKT